MDSRSEGRLAEMCTLSDRFEMRNTWGRFDTSEMTHRGKRKNSSRMRDILAV